MLFKEEILNNAGILNENSISNSFSREEEGQLIRKMKLQRFIDKAGFQKTLERLNAIREAEGRLPISNNDLKEKDFFYKNDVDEIGQKGIDLVRAWIQKPDFVSMMKKYNGKIKVWANPKSKFRIGYEVGAINKNNNFSGEKNATLAPQKESEYEVFFERMKKYFIYFYNKD